MHISEAYEHEALLSCSCEEGTGGCTKIGTQYVDIAAPLTLTPTAAVGSVSVTCQGGPDVTCVTDEDGESCTVTMTQRISVSVPIRYGVSTEVGEVSIACAEGGCGC